MNVREGGRCDVEEAAAQRFVGGKALCVSLMPYLRRGAVSGAIRCFPGQTRLGLKLANDERSFSLGTAHPKFFRKNLEVGKSINTPQYIGHLST